MSSIYWFSKCPQCQNPALYDTDSNGSHIACPLCGYTYSVEPIGDPSSDEYKLDKFGRKIYRKIEEQGYGVVNIVRKKSRGDIYYMKKPITPFLLKKYMRWLSSDEIDPEESYLTQWKEETKEVIVIVGNIEKALIEYIEDISEYQPHEFPHAFVY